MGNQTSVLFDFLGLILQAAVPVIAMLVIIGVLVIVILVTMRMIMSRFVYVVHCCLDTCMYYNKNPHCCKAIYVIIFVLCYFGKVNGFGSNFIYKQYIARQTK